MERSNIKAIIDNEIKKACELKSIDFNSIDQNSSLNLLESGIFDSLGILQLITLVEEKTNAEVDLSEYTPAEFTDYHKLISIFESSLETSQL